MRDKREREREREIERERRRERRTDGKKGLSQKKYPPMLNGFQ